MAADKSEDESADKSGLPGFERLSPQIWVQRVCSDEADLKTPLDQPSTVLLFGWGDGLPKHVAKYTAGFRTLYSQATIIVVLSPIMKVLREKMEASTQEMEPIVDLLFGPKHPDWASERILVHVMSNGGGMYFAATLNAYRRYAASGRSPFALPPAMPHVLLELDSTPGGVEFFPNIGRWSRAMAVGAAPAFPWPFAVTQALSFVFISGSYLLDYLRGHTSTSSFSRRAVNDPAMATTAAHRLYLYSQADDIIRWQDIEAHVVEAREKGYVADVEVFEGSPHVGHMRLHPEQYWGAIAKSWARAVQASQQ